MTRHLLLAFWLGATLCAALEPIAAAQTSTPVQTYTPAAETPEPTAPPFEIEPESFPMVTPLPPKAPLPLPTPEPSLEPEPTPEPTPSAAPTVRPTAKPTPKPTARPSAVPTSSPQTGKAELSYSFPKLLTEGRRFKVRLELKGQVAYPVKGVARFEDYSYDYSKKTQEAVPFELKGPGPQELSLLFRSPGRKTVRFETAAAPVRNAAVQAQPFAATVFPRPDSGSYERDPDLWQVWVNLHHSLSKAPQRQYYLVTYRGEIVQKLLTSSAAPGKLTPLGHFTLGVKIASPKSTLYDSVMPFWTTILIPGHSFEYGNHGLTGEAYLYHLGVPASHGCLRLSNKWISRDGQWVNIGGAKWVYSNVPVGTKIHIFKKPAQPFAFENYTMWLTRNR